MIQSKMFQIRIHLILLALLIQHDNAQKSSAAVIEKYGVTIRKQNGRTNTYLRWAGVILNKRFILSADVFDGKEKYNPREITIGIYDISLPDVGVGRLNGSKILKRERHGWSMKNVPVENVWVLQSLLLIKMMRDIDFHGKKHRVYLPDQDELKAWKNASAIPTNEDFTTSFWYQNRKSQGFFRRVITSERKCFRKICLREGGLIPSCLKMKEHRAVSVLRTGDGLVYKGTLVGIRKYTQYVGPYGDFPEDYFINVASQTEMLMFIMERGLKCRF